MKRRLCLGPTFLLLIFLLERGVVAASVALAPRATAPSPIVVAASQDWDGNDGPWSSFAIQVGTPPQNVKILAATSAWETLTVRPDGCIASDPADCQKLRGQFFSPNTSSTYLINTANLSTNIYPLAIAPRLGYNGKAAFGFDDVTLGWPGSGGPTLKNQTVGGFVTKDHYLGYFGLTPRAANFTSFANPIPSYVQNLVNQSLIPSTSWSYTAGNQYRFNDVLGSLVLGGYDSSKFVPNNVSFPFHEEDLRDLTLQLEAVTMTDGKSTTELLPTPIPAFMDSSESCIWLPMEACKLFEDAFGLVWDEKTSLYLVNSTQRTALINKKASVTFKLGNLTPGANVNIVLPYSAFDLQVSSPIVANATSYFPLKRAMNETQYTLGRTFFQEAYVTADYDRRTFSVSQCAWEAGAKQNIVSILPPGQKAVNETSEATNKSASSKPLPIGAIAGGAGGGVVLLIAVSLLVYFFCIKPRRRQAEVSAAAAAALASEQQAQGQRSPVAFGKPELDNDGEIKALYEMKADQIRWVVEADGRERMRYELDGKTYVYEKEDDGRTIVYELDARDKGVWVVEADGRPVEVYEMPAREEVAHEMGRDPRDSIEMTPRPPPRKTRTWDTAEGTLIGSPGVSNSPISPQNLSAYSERGRMGQGRLRQLPE